MSGRPSTQITLRQFLILPFYGATAPNGKPGADYRCYLFIGHRAVRQGAPPANSNRLSPFGSSGMLPPASKRHILPPDYFFCSHVWLPTVQEVLHADWQDVWHSPHPPFFTVLFNVCVFNVLICFILFSS